MTRYFLIVLTALILASPQPALAAWGDGLFPDAVNHWAAEPINFLGALDIVSGYPDGTCRPEQPLTVAEAVVLLLRSTEYSNAGGPGTIGRAPFIGRTPLTRSNKKPALPVPPAADWAAGDLALAAEQGVLTTAELQEDDILQPAPRYQVWQFLARALKVPLDIETRLDFSDASQVPAGAVPAAGTLVRLGILRGTLTGPSGLWTPSPAPKCWPSSPGWSKTAG